MARSKAIGHIIKALNGKRVKGQKGCYEFPSSAAATNNVLLLIIVLSHANRDCDCHCHNFAPVPDRCSVRCRTWDRCHRAPN